MVCRKDTEKESLAEDKKEGNDMFEAKRRTNIRVTSSYAVPHPTLQQTKILQQDVKRILISNMRQHA